MEGRFVSFEIGPSPHLLRNYTVGGIVWLASVTLPEPLKRLGPAGGANARWEGNASLASITDNPAGLLRVQSDAEASFVLHPAVGVQTRQNGSAVELVSDNRSARILNGTLDSGVVSVQAGAFLLHGGAVSAVAKTAASARHAIDAAVAAGHVAGRIQVHADGIDVLDLQNASVRARDLGNKSVRVVVDANFSSGRSFVVDLAPGLWTAADAGIRYFDEQDGFFVPRAIGRADSLEDALEASPGEGPEFWFVDAIEGAQAVVTVPEFSIHAFELFVIPPQVVPVIVYGAVMAFLFVGVAAAGIVLGRRD